MIIDCDTCRVRGPACGDCVVTVMLGPIGGRPSLDVAEQRAVGVLAASGLVPPLRLVPGAEVGAEVGAEERAAAGAAPPAGRAGEPAREAPARGQAAYDRAGDDGTARAG